MNKIAFLEGYLEKKALSTRTLTELAPAIYRRNSNRIAKAMDLKRATGNKAYRKLATKFSKNNQRLGRALYNKYPSVGKAFPGADVNKLHKLQTSLASAPDYIYNEADLVPGFLEKLREARRAVE